MKKLYLFFIALIILFSAISCNSNSVSNEPSEQSTMDTEKITETEKITNTEKSTQKPTVPKFNEGFDCIEKGAYVHFVETNPCSYEEYIAWLEENEDELTEIHKIPTHSEADLSSYGFAIYKLRAHKLYIKGSSENDAPLFSTRDEGFSITYNDLNCPHGEEFCLKCYLRISLWRSCGDDGHKNYVHRYELLSTEGEIQLYRSDNPTKNMYVIMFSNNDLEMEIYMPETDLNADIFENIIEQIFTLAKKTADIASSFSEEIMINNAKQIEIGDDYDRVISLLGEGREFDGYVTMVKANGGEYLNINQEDYVCYQWAVADDTNSELGFEFIRVAFKKDGDDLVVNGVSILYKKESASLYNLTLPDITECWITDTKKAKEYLEYARKYGDDAYYTQRSPWKYILDSLM